MLEMNCGENMQGSHIAQICDAVHEVKPCCDVLVVMSILSALSRSLAAQVVQLHKAVHSSIFNAFKSKGPTKSLMLVIVSITAF